jgi:hypothetical protein
VRGTRVALRWVRLYTRGLPADARAGRLAEIESDLWEHRRDAGEGIRTEAAIVSRCLRGAAADLGWRRAQRRGRPRRARLASVARGGAWTIAVASLLFLLGFQLYAASALVGLDLYGTGWPEGDVAEWARVNAALLALAVTGSILFVRLPIAGAGLVAAGLLGTAVVPLCPAMLLMLGPPAVSAAIAALLLARGRRQRASSATS